MNKISKTTKLSQEKHKRKKVKGEITRAFAAILSNRNDSIVRLDAAQSHELGRQLQLKTSLLSDSERAMLNRLIKMIAHSNGRTIVRTYFTKMLNKCLQTISRYYREFELLDLIRVVQTIHSPNQFYHGPVLGNEIVRNYLVGLLPSLRLMLGLSLLVVPQAYCGNVSQYNKKIHNSPVPAFKNKKITTRNRFTIAILELCDMVNASSPPIPSTNKLTFDQLGAIVMGASTIDISSSTENLSSITLTLAGRIKMTAFPVEAILYADQSLGKALAKKAVKDPFGYMFKTALIWSKEHSIQPNWNHMNELMRRHKQSESTPRYISIKTETVKRESLKEAPKDDKRASCCKFNDMNVGEKQEWLRSKHIAFSMKDSGPWPVISSHQEKLTCTH